MNDITTRAEQFKQRFADLDCVVIAHQGQLTLEVPAGKLHNTCLILRDEDPFHFEVLIDVCGVDYLQYGDSEWVTTDSTVQGFDRGVQAIHEAQVPHWQKPRFAVVYHLLSIRYNQRVRLRAFVAGEPPVIQSVVDVWSAANWFEREAFDLYGILFNGHPDLRRILTDYGFVGHPFRKDFPLIGEVEMRFDASEGRVVYEPVSIEPRILVPKVIRDDNRYSSISNEEKAE